MITASKEDLDSLAGSSCGSCAHQYSTASTGCRNKYQRRPNYMADGQTTSFACNWPWTESTTRQHQQPTGRYAYFHYKIWYMLRWDAHQHGVCTASGTTVSHSSIWTIRYQWLIHRESGAHGEQVHDSDTSTTPRHQMLCWCIHPSWPTITDAGIGVLIVNPQVQPTQTIYIKAKLTGSSSVLMAEAAALALAAAVTDCMNLDNITFLSDSELLVQFLNAADQSNPPDWRIKYYTQLFSNHSRCMQ